MNVDAPRVADFPAHLRGEAALFRRRGLREPADLVESIAEDLEAAIEREEEEPLTLTQAAAESGLSYSTLQQYVSQGRLPNAERSGSPRIRRKDLPTRGARRTGEGPDLAAELLLRPLE